jgi:SAM-dependent methyltransferase
MTMEASLQRRIQRYGWDRASSLYERYWSEQLAPAQRRLLEIAKLRPGESVLDVACGTGLVSCPAAAAVMPGGRLIGADISQRMVEAARLRADRAGCGNASFLRMDAEQLEFEDASFDAVLCALGLMYVHEPLSAVREMLRVLKAGGRACAAVWGRRSLCGWAEIFPIVDSRVESDVCPMFFHLGNPDNLERTFRDAGFIGVTVKRLLTALLYGSAEDACAAAFAGGPVAMAYSRFDERTRAEAHREYLASIEPYQSAGVYRIPGEFVVVSGLKP